MNNFIKVVCALLIMLSITAAAFSIPAYAATTTTASSTTGDVHDDRPDDGGSVGGDQSTATTSISAEARAWAKANGFDLAMFENYKAPAAHTPTAADITAFKNWMSGGSNPRNQVMKQIQSAAGDSIANELWNYCNTIWKGWMNTANVGSVVSQADGLKNVGAMQEGMFAGYFGAALGNSSSRDGYANAALLVKDGFVVSSDGKTYRLHNMIDGTIAYEMAAPESAVVSEDKFPEGVTSFTDFLPLEKQEATEQAKNLLKQYATEGSTDEPSNADRTVYQAVQEYINEKFGDYYGQCPGPTVVKGITALGIKLDSATEDTVGSSVGEKEFVASFFGTKSAAASLWRLGFLPSFDGTTYRLHSGKDGTVVYEISASKLLDGSDTASGKTSTSPWLYVGLCALVILLAAGGTAVYLKRKKIRNT